MTRDELITLLQQPQMVEEQHLVDLIDLSKSYPYCAPLHQLVLLTLYRMGDLRFSSELHRRSLYIPELRQLFIKLREMPEVKAHDVDRSIEAEGELTSSDIISQFLEEHPEDTREIEMLIDYQPEEVTPLQSNDVAEEAEVPTGDETSALIDSFLSKGPAVEVLLLDGEGDDAVTEDRSLIYHEEELFTETLARIYIRQGKYERARKILTQIHLEYPKKSSYFAEQISYLEKLEQIS